jgi:hypothetical protein
LPIQVCIGRYYAKPTVICDHCTKPIKNMDGIALWELPDSDSYKEWSKPKVPLFAHHRCYPEFSKGRFMAHEHLGAFLKFLTNNAGASKPKNKLATTHYIDVLTQMGMVGMRHD